MDFFKINEDLVETREVCNGSTIFIFDNFYQTPEEVANYLLSSSAPLWKAYQRPSFNGVHFEDRRVEVYEESQVQVCNFFEKVCGQPPLYDRAVVRSNQTKFYNGSFNRYEENYWFPHKDKGYTALVYLNKGNTPGTNLYVPLTNPPSYSKHSEHMQPWVKKTDWDCVKNLESSFNRAVLFDGKFFDHGMAIVDKRFFKEWRLNQVTFYKDN
jgi:hypothetical protein